MENSKLKSRIMRRVRTIYFLRKVINPFMIKLYAFVAFFVSVSSLVSLPDIIRNTKNISGIEQLTIFTTSAFSSTELTVQILSISIAFVAIWILFDLVNSYKNTPNLAH